MAVIANGQGVADRFTGRFERAMFSTRGGRIDLGNLE